MFRRTVEGPIGDWQTYAHQNDGLGRRLEKEQNSMLPRGLADLVCGHGE